MKSKKNEMLKLNLRKTHEVIRNLIMFIIFRFDWWHVICGYYRVAYKYALVKEINILKYNAIAEIGCGLCDILSRLEGEKKIGIDIDPNVLNASRIFYRDIEYIQADIFSDLERYCNILVQNGIEIVLMVNWIHNIPTNELVSLVKELKQRQVDVCLDVIKIGVIGYRFHHEFELSNQFKIKRSIEVDETRKIIIV